MFIYKRAMVSIFLAVSSNPAGDVERATEWPGTGTDPGRLGSMSEFPLTKKVIFRVKLLIYQRVSRLISHSIPIL